ncbi:Uncharacterised protein [uncultured archaeon]|nr:Uncharacterised protein [uncultured archaeon]
MPVVSTSSSTSTSVTIVSTSSSTSTSVTIVSTSSSTSTSIYSSTSTTLCIPSDIPPYCEDCDPCTDDQATFDYENWIYICAFTPNGACASTTTSTSVTVTITSTSTTIQGCSYCNTDQDCPLGECSWCNTTTHWCQAGDCGKPCTTNYDCQTGCPTCYNGHCDACRGLILTNTEFDCKKPVFNITVINTAREIPLLEINVTDILYQQTYMNGFVGPWVMLANRTWNHATPLEPNESITFTWSYSKLPGPYFYPRKQFFCSLPFNDQTNVCYMNTLPPTCYNEVQYGNINANNTDAVFCPPPTCNILLIYNVSSSSDIKECDVCLWSNFTGRWEGALITMNSSAHNHPSSLCPSLGGGLGEWVDQGWVINPVPGTMYPVNNRLNNFTLYGMWCNDGDWLWSVACKNDEGMFAVAEQPWLMKIRSA